MDYVICGVQAVVALGLLNVWVLRLGKSTGYRGGDAQNLKEEFSVYGLPPLVFYIVGGLKVASALALLGACFYPELRLPAAGTLVGLMIGAILMHIKVKDPLQKSLPAICMLLMNGFLLWTSLTSQV